MDAETRASNRVLMLAVAWAVLVIGGALVIVAVDQPLLDGRKLVGLLLAAAGVLGIWRVGIGGAR